MINFLHFVKIARLRGFVDESQSNVKIVKTTSEECIVARSEATKQSLFKEGLLHLVRNDLVFDSSL